VVAVELLLAQAATLRGRRPCTWSPTTATRTHRTYARESASRPEDVTDLVAVASAITTAEEAEERVVRHEASSIAPHLP